METTEHPTSAAPSIRASDADRETISTVLHQAAAAGMLTLAEVDERLASLYTARFRHELDALTDDLPAEVTSTSAGYTGATVRDSLRAVGVAVLGLILALASIARRHPRITATIGLVLVAALVVLMAFGGPETGGHELHGAHEMGGH